MIKSSTLYVIIMFACMNASSLPTIHSFYYSPSSGEQIRSNLYAVAADTSTILLDGDLTQYDPSFTDAVDGMDARKMSNFSENLGMVRGNTTLVIERRHTITVTDTIFYKLWNTHQQLYQLEFITSNLDHPGLVGYLEDTYLHTSATINLNGANNINFSVNSDPASSAIYRFQIIFASAESAVLPLTFTSVKAYQQNNTISVEWKTENEKNMKAYNVEKSIDGNRFNSVSGITANNFPVNNYSWTDAYPTDGYNYYRIRSTDINGEIKYSEVIKVLPSKATGDIKIFPNPVTDNTIHLQIGNQPGGLYELRLVNKSGQSVMIKQIHHADGTSTETIRQAQLIPKGIYQLEITKPDGSKTNISLVY
ncbi:MAG: T9SS type A sorting domain-containing protein [Ginsengibacter sp.]